MGDVVSVFRYLFYFPSYDVINDVIMSDADCTTGREPRSVAASFVLKCWRTAQVVNKNFIHLNVIELIQK